MTGKIYENIEEPKNRNLQVTFRVLQAIFFGILALGISSMSGDFSSYLKSPVSSFSIMTSIFGLMGSIITGRLAKNSKDW